MKIQRICGWLVALATLSTFSAPCIRAQSIIPANDGTFTLVTKNGDRFTIEGGQLSGDGANLFHSFEQFGLSKGEIASFLSHPEIRNIMARVVGGDRSFINGLLQVTGSNANLYLSNPAGIIFGPNARLDVPSSFLATTANGIQFGDRWFNAFGPNDYANLVGDPGAFAFTMANPGAILNEGNLAVKTGHNLTLLGGSVVNTGTLSAPGGKVTIAAVPGKSAVRIGLEGHALSLEIQPLNSGDSQPLDWPHTIHALPTLLTTGSAGEELEVSVNPDGSLKLKSSEIPVPLAPQTTVVSGQVDVSGQVGGTIAALGERVALLSAELDASGQNGGGTILIGGGYQGQGSVPNAEITVVDETTTINADATNTGDGGTAIIWADNATRFDGELSAQGGALEGDGGFAEISGKQNLSFNGQVNLLAPKGNSGIVLFDPDNILISSATGDDGPPGINTPTASDPDKEGILFGDTPSTDPWNVTPNELKALNSSIILQANDDITFAAPLALTIAGHSITAQAGNNIFVIANITTSNGAVTLTANDNTNGTGTGAGAITMGATTIIDAGNQAITLTAAGNISVSNLRTSGTASLSSTAGAIEESGSDGAADITANTINLNAATGIGTAGQIEIAADQISADSTAGNIDLENNATNATTVTSITTGGTGAIGLTQTGNQTLSVTTATTANGAIDIENAGATLTVGSATAGGNNDLSLTTTTSGDVVIDDIDATGDTVTISSAGAIEESGTDPTPPDSTDIRASTIDLNAATGIGTAADHIETAADQISADSATGDILLENRAANATTVTSITTGGMGNIIQLTQTGSQPLTLDVARADGDITVTVQDSASAGDNLTVSSSVTSDNGSITLDVGDEFSLPAGATINAPMGTVTIQVDNQTNPDNATSAGALGEGVLTVLGAITSRVGSNTTILRGGDDGDTFNIQSALIRAVARGQDGNDIFNLDSGGSIPNLEGSTGSDTINLNGGTVTNVDGGGGSNELVNTANGTYTWTFDPSGALGGGATAKVEVTGGTLVVNNFSNIDELRGGTDTDIFNIGSGSLTRINGGDEGNATGDTINLRGGSVTSVEGDGGEDTILLEGVTATTISGGDGGDIITLKSGSITTVNGDGGDDSITLDFQTAGMVSDNIPLAVPVTIDGDNSSTSSDSNTLTLLRDPVNPANTSIWHITAPNAGNIQDNIALLPPPFIGNTIVSFSNVENLVGGPQEDHFIFHPSTGGSDPDGSIGGTIAGRNCGSCGAVDRLDYSLFTADIAVDLQQLGASGIERVIGTTPTGGTPDSTLIGINTLTTWTINGTNTGEIDIREGNTSGFSNDNPNDVIEFEAFSTLQGRGEIDRFELGTTGNINTLKGEGGDDFFNLNGAVVEVSGNDGIDTVNANGAIVTTISTGAGDDRINLGNGSNVTKVSTGSGADTVILSTTNIETRTKVTQIDLGEGDDTLEMDDSSRVTDLDSGPGNDMLEISGNASKSWTITDFGSGQVSVGEILIVSKFSATENFISGDGEDTVMFQGPNAAIPGSFAGKAGNLTLQGEMDIDYGGELSGQGMLTLEPKNPNQTIRIGGDNNSDALDLSSEELALLADGFSKILIGGSNMSGTILLVGDASFKDPTILQATETGGRVDRTAGTLIGTGDASLTVLADQQVTLGDVITIGQAIAINSDKGGIQAGNIVTTGPSGGRINLNAEKGNIQVSTLQADGLSGPGGAVDAFTQKFFRATGVFSNRDGIPASISASGIPGGDILIFHGGGSVDEPFVVGDPNAPNGTAFTITTGEDSIFPVEAYFGSFTLGEIRLRTPKKSVACPPICEIAPEEAPESQVPELEDEPQALLQDIQARAKVRPALLYISFLPKDRSFNTLLPQVEASLTQQTEQVLQQQAEQTLDRTSLSRGIGILRKPRQDDFLVLSLVVPKGKTVRKEFPNIQRREVVSLIQDLQRQVTRKPDIPQGLPGSLTHQLFQRYLAPAKKLYQLLLADEIEAGLAQSFNDRGDSIDNLVFVVDPHLPPLPVAALHDGEKFLVERYSLGLMPSLNLTDTNYTDVRDTQVLLMGASEFTFSDNARRLPAVDVELEIVQNLWAAKEPLKDQNFTLEELRQRRRTFGIVHLATHGKFFPNKPEQSFLLFGNESVSFEEIRQTRSIAPPMELLVLSACDTASSGSGAELGFAGLAYQLGAKTVLASLWDVNDRSALSLIALFYNYLQKTSEVLQRPLIKAEALQQAQLAILRGQVVVKDGKLLIYEDEGKTRLLALPGMEDGIPLPAGLEDVGEFASYNGQVHPAYWAGFTMVGSPW